MEEITCTLCGETFPATTEFFYEDRRYDPPRLIKRCKPCKIKNALETSDPEKRRAAIDRWQKEHPEKVKAAVLKWARAHKEHKRDYDKRYGLLHVEKRQKNARDWKESNPERAKQRHYEWCKNHPAALRALGHRWRAIQRGLPHAFTGEDLQFAVNYFGGCVYCGHAFDESHKMTGDHFIPVSSPDCPGTIPENMLPACHSCNYSKHNRRAEDWLSKKFGETESYLILQRIQSYFEHLKQLRSR